MTAFEIYQSKQNPLHYVAIEEGDGRENAEGVRNSQNLQFLTRVPDDGERYSFGEKIRRSRNLIPVILLITGVVGSIYAGVATPTEAGALGALFALLIGVAQGRASWDVIKSSVMDALRTTSSLFFLAIGAVLLTRFLAMAGVPSYIANIVASYDLGEIQLVIALAIIYLILGMFLDPLGIMLLTLPVFLPAFEALDVNLIWIGVIVVKMIEIGLLTPPVGLNVYIVKNVVGDAVPLSTIFKGVGWFLVCEFFIMWALIYNQSLSLWLPGLMMGN